MKFLYSMSIFSLLLISAAQASPNRTLSSVEAAKQLSDKAMRDAVKGDYRRAFNRFRQYWPLSKKEIDQAISEIESGIQEIHKRFGKPIAYEFVEKKSSKGFLVRFVYVQKFQNALVRWLFTYYKPGKNWHVLGVSFDDNYEALLQ